MAYCLGCGASYEDNFKFCPHCGRSKPTPETVHVKVEILPRKFEEAALKLQLIDSKEMSEPPFDWKPNILDYIDRDANCDCKHINIYVLALESHHPTKGHYIAHESTKISGYPFTYKRERLFSKGMIGRLKWTPAGRQWIISLFSNRRKAWDGLNSYLINEGWVGITSAAIDRSPPFDMGLGIEIEGKADLTKLSRADSGKLDLVLANPFGPFVIGTRIMGHGATFEQYLQWIERNYRYQRPI